MDMQIKGLAPTPEALIAAARDMVPDLQRESSLYEDQRQISSGAAQRLRDAGFFRICQSIENGGYGMRPSVLWRVSREIARGDTAAAWILSLAGLHPWMAGMFPVAAQDEVFANGKDAVVLALTGNVGRAITATFDGAHYTLTGKWTYASGIDVADWAAVLAEVPVSADASEPTEPRLLLVPKSSFRIDHDSWKVFGMRGTGSKDVYLTNERVPVHRTLRWKDVQTSQVAGTERNKGPMYRIPHTSLFVMSVTAPIVAVASGLLDVYVDTVQRRIPAGLKAPQTEDRFSLACLGSAASRIHMAFSYLMHEVDEMWDQACANQPFTIEQRARYRTSGATICDTAMKAADDLVRNLGGSLLPVGPIERYFRDIHGMASHFLMQINPSAELYGRTILGLPLPPAARI